MSTDEQSQMVDDISSIIMRGRYGRSGVGRPSDNPLDLRDARRIVEYVMAHDARVRRDAAREALDGLAEAMQDTPGIGPGTKDHRSRMRTDVHIYRNRNYPETEDQT